MGRERTKTQWARTFISGLYPIDVACLRHVRAYNSCPSDSETVRLAIANEAALCGNWRAERLARRLAKDLTGARKLTKSPGVARMKKFFHRYGPEHAAALDRVMDNYRLVAAEAIRLAIRCQATRDGFNFPDVNLRNYLDE